MKYHDDEEAARLNAEQWQLDLLKLNPEYLGWGPHEDYMIVRGEGWNAPQTFATWAEFGPWELNDLNECVNFYFTVNRASEDCTTCAGKGTHPDAQWISESWYSHSSPFKPQGFRAMQAEAFMERFGGPTRRLHGFGNYPSEELLAKYGPAFREFCEEMRTRGHWSDAITQDEVQALVDGHRLMDFTHTFTAGEGWKPKEPSVVPTADEVNAWARGRGMGHDSINHWIAVKRRCERLGVPSQCPACEGHGYVHTEPAAHVSLTLWWLHPRKGCSRGLEVTRLQQEDMPAVFAFLRGAAERNAERFSRIPDGVGVRQNQQQGNYE
jgi:hypothetical protein